MRLYVIRHGPAETSSSSGDFGRRLTLPGRRLVEDVTRRLGEHGARFDVILHSPLTRAMETAELLAPLSAEPPISTMALAAPPDEALLREIRAHGESVAVVGHLPWVGETVEWLVRARPSEASQCNFPPASVAMLEGAVEPGGMRLDAIWRADAP